jgi:WD40 repeat protein/tRNA A-37 threonylcarbamoyl transferase component Bud32/tetratricopeptide (TPR) repeat protein
MTTTEEAVAQFRRWRQRSSASLQEYLGQSDAALTTDTSVLRELAAAAIAEEWQLGRGDETIDSPAFHHDRLSPRFVEWYSQRWAKLRDEAVLRQLIQAERDARIKVGATIAPHEYQKRFPALQLTDEPTTADQETLNFVQPLEGTQGMVGTSPARSAPEAGSTTKQFGEYEILEEIAQGGMGVVYKARQPRLNRVVALKRILSGQLASAADVERFLTEAKAAAQLDHPGIVPVFEVGEVDGDHFFSMGFIDGDSLDRHLRGNVLAPKESVALILQVTEAVAYAHTQGVIHRDLKPSNVLVSPDGRLRVTDFGLAKTIATESGLTVSGQVLGTPSYMPPEQALGRIHDVDERSDLYSLGATLYFMLTGRPPFQTANIVETLRQVTEATPVSPRMLNPQVDRDLETIVMRCLEKESQHRFATANELAEELGRYLRDEPIQSRRVGSLARAVRWCRRRPIAAGLVAALIALAVLGPLAVSLGRQAATSRHLQRLTQQFETGLDALPSNGDGVEQLREIAQEIAVVSGQDVQPDQARIVSALAERITRHLQTARLATTDVQNLRSGIGQLETLDSAAAFRLSDVLQRRMSSWQTAAAYDVGAADVSVFSPSEQVHLQPDGRISVVPGADTTSLRAPLALGSLRTVATWEQDGKLEATLANWQGEARLSLHNREGDSSYEFIVKRKASLADDASDLTEMRIEIRKNGIPVLHQNLHWGQESDEDVTLRATKEGNRLTFQVNEQQPISFFDPFPFQTGAFGVSAADGTRLRTLAAARRVYAEALSPLERADVAFAKGEFEPALQAYLSQANATAGTAFEAEAHYKAALCLEKLARPDEAASELQAVAMLDIQPWKALARVQEWLRLVRGGNADQADAMFDLLQSDYSFEQLAALVPSEIREEIVTSYLTGINARMGLVELDERQMERVARASRVDRLLSPDGLGDIGRQIELSRVYRMAGRLDDAEKVLEPLVDGSGHHLVLKHYSRVLRIAGQAGEAVKLLDNAISENDSYASVFLDRAYAHIAVGDFALAEADAARALRLNPPPPATSFPHLQSQIRLLRGFLKKRVGDDPGAIEEWRIGYTEARGLFDITETAANTSLVLLLIMGALSDELQADDAARFVELTLASEVGPIAAVTSMINKQTITDSSRTMWDTPRGMEIAERFAYDSLPIQDRIRSPLALAGVAFARQGAFQHEISQDEEQVLWDLLSGLAEDVGQRRQLGTSAIMQLGLTWKGMTNLLGWGGVSPALSPDQRSRFAYLFAHRFLARGDRPQAMQFLKECVANSSEDSTVRQLAQQALELIDQQQGRLSIRGNSVEDALLLVKEGDETVATLAVGKTSTENLAPGDYLLTPSADSATRVSRQKVRVRVGRVHEVTVDRIWKPGPPGGLAGLLAHPADLQGIGRWQLVRKQMQGVCQSLAINPGHDTVAAAGNDGIVRLFDAETCEPSALLAGHADRVVSLDWHPDGRRLLSADVGGGIFIWDAVDQKRLATCKYDGLDPRVAWHPQGGTFAVCGWKPAVEFRDTNGELLQSVTHPGNYRADLTWSPDGSKLATVRSDRLSLYIWRFSGYQELRQVQLAARPITCRWSPDGKLIGLGQLNGYEVVSADTWQTVSSATKLPAHPESFVWEPDSRHFWTCGWGEAVRRWDVGNSEDPVVELKRYGNHRLVGVFDEPPMLYRNNPNGFLKLSVDGQQIGVGGQFPRRDVRAVDCFGELHVAAIGDGRLLLRSETGSAHPPIKAGVVSPSCLRWSPDGQTLATGAYDGKVQLWRSADGQWQPSTLGQHDSQVLCIDWSPTGKRLASISRDGLLRIDVLNGSVKPIETRFQRPVVVRSIAWEPGGQQLAVGTAGKEVILISSHGTEIQRLALQGPNAIGLSYTEDGKLYVGAGWRVELWQPRDNRLLTAWPVGEAIRSVVTLPDGRAIAGGERGLLTLCDSKALGQPAKQRRLNSLINDMAMGSGRADSLLVACEDGTLREIGVPDLDVQSLLIVLDDGQIIEVSDSGESLRTNLPDSTDGTLSVIIEATDGTQQLSQTSIPSPFDDRSGT